MGRPSKDRVQRTYTIDRETAEYIDSLPDGERSNFVSESLKVARERTQQMKSLFYTEEEMQYIQEWNDKWLKKYSAEDLAAGNVSPEDLEEMNKFDPRDPMPHVIDMTGRNNV